MRLEPLSLAGLLDSSRRRLMAAFVLGLGTVVICLAGTQLTSSRAIVFGAVSFVVVWAAEACLCSAARRTLADR